MSTNAILDGLNDAQRAAVSTPAGATLVVAGPGSGKTRVLTRRVAYLITEMGVYPEEIMAVTFTNKAAGEMRVRIEKILGRTMRGLAVGTFHALCARILRREAAHIALRPDFLIYDTEDQLATMKVAIEDLNLDSDKFKPRSILSAVSAAKNELITPDTYPDTSQGDRLVAKLYRRYDEILRASNALDFDDLLMLTVFLFRRAPAVIADYRSLYKHILVDEFQDTNAAQYALLRLLEGDTEPQNSLFCVGDPDQSIYAFRGADYRNVTRFQADHPHVRVILLEENYRSHQAILDAAMAIIDRNPNRIKKNLTTPRTDSRPIMAKQLSDDRDEADYVAWTIREYQRMGHPLRDCAIMYRTNAQSRTLEESFRRLKLPYRLIGGVRFYGRKEVKDVLAYLRLIVNPDDSISLKRIINIPRRGIGATTISQLEGYAGARGMSVYAALLALPHAADSPFNSKAKKLLGEFTEMIERWRSMVATTSVSDLVRDILETTHYIDSINDGSEEGKDRAQNVQELYNATKEAGEITLSQYLQDVSLVADVDNYDEDAEGVVLLTLHSAKGLEFPIVFIVGLEDGVLPHQNSSDDPEKLSEERRLLYVGITRAEEHLHLTWKRRRAGYGGSPGEFAIPSRFLADLPERLVTGSPLPGSAAREVERRRAELWTPSPAPVHRPPTPRPQSNVQSFYKSGQRVRHERFGDGTILGSVVRGEEEEITVKFDRVGIKRLAASVAPLTLLEE
ncbi:MAG TPA: UvrD-helicase domain-containing protein [Aggregatilineales bacterium]|nr:UvrD-helicase domain-containing protein [Anaerolineales bacterium]HRE47301.1 UvrD-helicase domain-containing protein [Aggregatilineales bacterium]